MEHLSPGASLPEAPSSASRERELFAELDALKERLRVSCPPLSRELASPRSGHYRRNLQVNGAF